MTTTANRRTCRETTALQRDRGRSRPVIVVLTGDQLEMRLKGCRARYRLPVSMAFLMAVQSHVAAEKARRKAERAARRAAR